MTKVTFIIIHYKGIAETYNCLESLTKLNKNNISFEVILIDNSKYSEFEKKAKASHLDIRYFKFPENIGFSQGVNLGLNEVRKSNLDYVILLNSDTIIPPDFLISIVNFAKNNKKYEIISPKIYFAPGYEYHSTRYDKAETGKVIWYAGGNIDWNNVYPKHEGLDEVDNSQLDKVKEVDFVTGCCMLIRPEVIDKIGYFDEKYFAYYEDVDFSMRARNKGIKICYTPEAYIWHKNALSSGKPGSPLHVYLQTRNRFYFGLKYAPFKVKLHLLKKALSLLFSHNVSEKKGARDFLLNKMYKGASVDFDKN